MNDQFSIYRYTVELTFLDKLDKCKWWQFSKRRAVYKWRDSKLTDLKNK